MLYVTTRSHADFYTAHRALNESRGPDRGLYLPMRMPVYTEEKIRQLRTKSFFQNAAEILNLFFSADISDWDVKICFGRSPVHFSEAGPRITVAEFWHNMDFSYQDVSCRLYAKMTGREGSQPQGWAQIAIRIAALFGLFGEQGLPTAMQLDFVVPADDFAIPMALWYARQMGLPIGRILCACNDSSAVWDLIQRGSIQTGNPSIYTEGPEQTYPVPDELERLICCTLGTQEVLRFDQVRRDKGVYQLSREAMKTLSRGLFAGVVGSDRVSNVVSSVYKTQQYIMDPGTAIAYGCLQDYRARTRESRYTLLLSDRSPLLFEKETAQALGISREKLRTLTGGM